MSSIEIELNNHQLKEFTRNFSSDAFTKMQRWVLSFINPPKKERNPTKLDIGFFVLAWHAEIDLA
jgi:hypothetical protein